MSEILFTINPADIEGWKAQARAAGAGDDVYKITVEDCASELVIRRPTKAEWLDYFNKSADPNTAQEAHANLCSRCVLWIDHRAAKRRGPAKSEAEVFPPIFQIIASLATEMVAFRIKVVDRIEEIAGWTDEEPREALLTVETPREVVEAFGVDYDAAIALAQRYNQSKLALVSLRVSSIEDEQPERVVLVVRKPDPASFTAFVRDTNSKSKAEARHALAVACTVYPGSTDDKGVNVEAQRLLAMYPGAAAKLCDPIAKLGGASARTTAKKL